MTGRAGRCSSRIVLAVLLGVCVQAASAQSARLAWGGLTVTPAWLAAHPRDTDLVILQVGIMDGESEFAKGHIPGARSIPFTEVAGGMPFFKSPEQLAALFTGAGIPQRDTVVAYCHVGQQATAVLFAARMLGHPVLLYDGSFEEWARHSELPVDDPSAGRRK